MSKQQDVDGAKMFALESLLALHFSRRELVPNPSRNKIYREWYLNDVGIAAASKEVAALFERYDHLAAAAEAINATVISTLDSYMEQAIERRTLAMQNRRIIAIRVGDILGLSPQQLKHPTIVGRLKDWGKKVADLDYAPDTRAITRENRERAASPPKRLSAFRERTLSERGGSQTSTGKLESILAEHQRTNSFIRNDLGRLEIGAYAKLIGREKEEITPAHRRILFKYEREAGPVLSATERKIPKIKAWFRSGVEKRTLPCHSGKIEEQALRDKFSISRRKLAACQPLLDLIADFNNTLTSIGYRPKELFELENALLRVLPNARLHKSGLSIDRLELARKLKCSAARLSRAPLSALVDDADEQHRARIAKDPAWVCFPDRAFDFRRLIALGFSEDVVHRLCKALLEGYMGTREERRMRIVNALFAFFARLAQVPFRAVRTAFNAVNQRTPIADHEWRMALDEIALGVGKSHLKYFNAIIQHFGDAGVLPRTSHRLKLPKKPKTPNSRPTVAEVVPKPPESVKPSPEPESVTDPSVDVLAAVKQYVSFAHWMLLQKSSWNEAGAEFKGDDFLAVLRTEIENWEGALPKDPVQAISQIIKRRLALIGEAAKKQFDHWRDYYLEGQALLNRGVDPSAYEYILFGNDRTSALYLKTLRRYFPKEGAKKQQGLANLLRLIRDRHGGIVPVQDGDLADQFFAARCREYASLVEIQARLMPHREMHAAALTMYLVESGCNVAVAITLFRDCIEDTDAHGFKKITGYKARANGKPIVINLPEDSVAIDALSWLRDNNDVARNNAPPDIRELLFVTRLQGSVTEIADHWLLVQFKKIIASLPSLASLRLTPVMMRPSVLLRHALDNDGDLRVGLAYAQHDQSTTGVYQVRLPTKYIYDQLFSQFQRRLQRIVQRMANQLRDNAKPVIEPEAKPVGIGGVCQVGGCRELNCWNNCSNLVVIPEVNALADWQIWNRALKEARGEWERDRIDRWEAMWLPFLCFTDVLESKMKDPSLVHGDVSKLWDRATDLANEMMSRSDFVMPRPF